MFERAWPEAICKLFECLLFPFDPINYPLLCGSISIFKSFSVHNCSLGHIHNNHTPVPGPHRKIQNNAVLKQTNPILRSCEENHLSDIRSRPF